MKRFLINIIKLLPHIFVGVLGMMNWIGVSGQIPVADGFDYPLKGNADTISIYHHCTPTNFFEIGEERRNIYDEGNLIKTCQSYRNGLFTLGTSAVPLIGMWGGQATNFNSNNLFHIGEDWGYFFWEEVTNSETGNLELNFNRNEALGKPVYAIANGTVIYVEEERDSCWQDLIVIQHKKADGSEYLSLYGHLKNLEVFCGQDVFRGKKIGYIDNPTCGGPHLHLEIINESHVNWDPSSINNWPKCVNTEGTPFKFQNNAGIFENGYDLSPSVDGIVSSHDFISNNRPIYTQCGTFSDFSETEFNCGENVCDAANTLGNDDCCGDWYRPYLNCLKNKTLSNSYTNDGTPYNNGTLLDGFECTNTFDDDDKPYFYPQKPVTRKEMAKLLVQAGITAGTLNTTQIPTSPATYNDVPTNHPYFHWIQLMRENYLESNLITHFNPDGYVTRAEMCKYLVKAFDIDAISNSSVEVPSDVLGHSFEDEIRIVLYTLVIRKSNSCSSGVTIEMIWAGKNSSNFGTEEIVTRAEMCKFLLNGFDAVESSIDITPLFFSSLAKEESPNIFKSNNLNFTILGERFEQVLNGGTPPPNASFASSVNSINTLAAINSGESVIIEYPSTVDSDGDLLSFYWVSEEGTLQALTNDNRKVTYAPPLTSTQSVYEVFTVAGDGNGNTSNTIFTIIVQPQQASFSVSPSTLNFGDVAINDCEFLEYTITNPATSNSPVSGSVSLSDPSGAFNIPTGTFNVYPGNTITGLVEFCPTAAGNYGAFLNIVPNDNSTPSQSINLSGNGTSQNGCSGGSLYPFGSLYPSSSYQTVDQIFGGEYSIYQVENGEEYKWTFCSNGGNAPFDSELTLLNSNGSNVLAYSNDHCGYDAEITWTANFTGTVRVLVTKYNCQSINSGNYGTLAYRKTSTDPPPSAAPILVSPAHNTTGISSSGFITLNWNAVANADYYHLQVSTDSDWGGIYNGLANPNVLDINVFNNDTDYFLNPDPNTEYFWTVTAVNDGGNGPYANKFRFTTGGTSSSGACNISGGYQFGVLTPNNYWYPKGCYLSNDYTLFNVVQGEKYVWSFCPSDGTPTEGYGNASFDSQLTLTDNNTGQILAFADDECGDDARLEWEATFTGVVRIRPTKKSCDTNYGGTGDCTVLVYRLLGPPTESPNLQVPANFSQEVNSSQPIYFQWSNVDDATGYILQISTSNGYDIDEGLSNPIFEITLGNQTSYNWTGGSSYGNGYFYWTVAAINDGGIGEFRVSPFRFNTKIPGCTNANACNYDLDANTIDNSCVFPDCAGNCGGSATSGNSCNDGNPNTTGDTWDANCNCTGSYIYGCTDVNACNYNSNATSNDGSCLFLDCNGVCGGIANPGSLCSDGNPNTQNDIYDVNCICIGSVISCIPIINITQNVLNGQFDQEHAGDELTASNEIFAGANADYRAENRIRLTTGFRAHNGSSVGLYIEDCTPISNKTEEIEEIAPNNLEEVEAISDLTNLSLFPNPASTEFNIRFNLKEGTPVHVRIFNQTGQTVGENEFDGIAGLNQFQFDSATLPNGIYMVELLTANERIVERVEIIH